MDSTLLRMEVILSGYLIYERTPPSFLIAQGHQAKPHLDQSA
jgi:hypothetical protein